MSKNNTGSGKVNLSKMILLTKNRYASCVQPVALGMPPRSMPSCFPRGLVLGRSRPRCNRRIHTVDSCQLVLETVRRPSRNRLRCPTLASSLDASSASMSAVQMVHQCGRVVEALSICSVSIPGSRRCMHMCCTSWDHCLTLSMC